ncbi:MAG: hypothetical protein IPK75_18170 [Acidobacteria bacterium]|nr:hypothetical protein [Acidobacteriota bacterium]
MSAAASSSPKSETRPMRPRVEFPFNTTVLVTLQNPKPAGPYPSRYENGRPSYLYTVLEGDVEKSMFLDDSQKDMVDALHVTAGTMIAITKKEVRITLPDGKPGRKAEWTIVDPSAAIQTQRNARSPFPARSADEINAEQRARELADDIARRKADEAAASSSTFTPALKPYGDLIRDALCQAIDACAAAREYAAAKGIAVEFSPDDYRGLASTIFIQRSKGGAL